MKGKAWLIVGVTLLVFAGAAVVTFAVIAYRFVKKPLLELSEMSYMGREPAHPRLVRKDATTVELVFESDADPAERTLWENATVAITVSYVGRTTPVPRTRQLDFAKGKRPRAEFMFPGFSYKKGDSVPISWSWKAKMGLDSEQSASDQDLLTVP